MREKQIESKLSMMAKKRGGLCEKWNAGTAGWADRIILMPDGKIAFAELKAPGEKPRKDQLHRMSQLKQLGCIVGWADSREKVDGFLLELQSQRDANDLLVDILEAGGLI